MAKPLTSALALLLALAAAPVLAQDAAAPTEGEAPAATEAEAATDPATAPGGLAMGVEVQGDGVGANYTAATFGDWEQRCVRTESGADPCQLYILLRDEQDNAVAEFTMFGLPEAADSPAAAGATLIAPLETLLTAGVTLQIDAGAQKAYPFTFCTQIGCVARLGFTAEEVAEFKAGANAVISIAPFVAPDERVTLAMSLNGFTAGYDAVNAANEAADAAAAAAAAEAPAEAPADAPADGEPATND